jgi:5'-nucleotidase
MRILLTNDDGVSSPGLTLLAAALRNCGNRVIVFAPDTGRSGSSHAITFLNAPVKIAKIEEDTWSCSGTPADCLVVALRGGLPNPEPDLILSGINHGANLGTDIVFSGTAAAARQGSFYGIPSIALSLVEGDGDWHWGPAISFIINNLEKMKSYWKAGTFVNVNFPNIIQGPSALVPAFPAIRYYDDWIDILECADNSVYGYPKKISIEAKVEKGSDWYEVLQNNASLSVIFSQPVQADFTERERGNG